MDGHMKMKAFQDSQGWHQAVLLSTMDGYWMTDPQGRLLEINESYCRMSGYSQQELLGMRIGDLEAIETVDQTVARILKIKNHGNDRFESYHRRKDGTVFPVEVSTQYLPADDGRYVVFVRDITDRKRLEKNLYDQRRRLESIIEGERVGTWEWNVQTGETVFNEAWAQIIGYTLEELAPVSIQTWERFTHPDDLRASNLLLERHFSGVLPYYESECRMRHKGGHWVWVSDRGRVLSRSEDGKPLMMFGTHAEVTERKREEENLRVAKGFSESIIEHAAEGVCVWHNIQHYPYVRFTVWNRRMQEITGYSMAEINRLGWYQTIYSDPVISEQVQERMEHMRTGDDLHNEGWEITRSDGQKRFLEINTTILPSHDGQTHVLALMHDITARKKAEEKLRASEEKYRGIFDCSIAAIYLFDQDKHFIDSNQAGVDLLGYSREELLQISIPDVDADPVIVLPAHAELLSGGRLINYEHQLRRKDKSIITVLNNSIPLTESNGNVIGMLSTLLDITDRKRVEEALKAENARFNALMAVSSDGIAIINQEHKVVKTNRRFAEMLGYTLEEVIMLHTWDFEAIMTEAQIRKDFKDLTQTNCTFQSKHRRKDGTTYDVEVCAGGAMVFNEPMVLTLSRDITERKKAEEALKESQNRYRAVFENSADAIFLTRTDGSILSCNDAACRMFGRSQEELVKVGRNGVIDAEDPRLADALAERTSTGLFKGELGCIRKDGSKFPGEITSAVFQNTSESSLTCTIIRDISRRKQAEKRSLIQLELALGLASVSSLTEGLRLCLDAALKVGEFEGGGFYLVDERSGDLDLVAQRGLSQDFVKAAMRYGSESHNAQLVMAGKPAYKRHKKMGLNLTEPENREGLCFLAVIPIRDDERVIGCLNVASRSVNDIPSSSRESLETIAAEAAHAITRLRAQEALHDSHSLLTATLESTADGLLVVDTNGRVTKFNRKFLELWRIPESLAAPQDDALMLQFVLDQLQDSAAFMGKVQNLYQNSAASSRDELVFKDGRVFERVSQPQRMGDNIVGRVWSFRDITERKRAENKIKASETFIRDVIDSLSSSLAVLDHHGTIIEVNAAWKRRATDNGCLDRNFYIGTNYLDVCEKAAATGLGIELLEIAGGIRSVIDRSESSYGREYSCQTPSGDLWSRMKVFSLNTPEAGAVIIHDDITAQKQAERSILNALDENQVLLQEIHHRVKNNLQVVIGLLGLQTGQLKNPTVKEALQVSQQRIKVMAMIHETLHQGQNLAAVSLAGFLMKLTQQLKNAYNQHATILVTVEAEEIVLKMDQAIPCGLIVNELVTNALKYAFPRDGSGQVHIKASRIDGSRMELTVTDNGIGLPPSVDLTRPSSLGLRMVRGLVEHQLSGSFHASVSGGTTFVMRWAL
jgi:PAS domain S-box-containing protein